ncbi:MAG: CpsB/CapC family capsule biosynthesis tyrosine phosphatase [Eubacterium sp.]
MIDMHTHVLYGIDDGSQSIDDSVEMLKKAEELGFRGVVLTPHYMSYTNYVSRVNENRKRFKKLIDKLKEENMQIQLFLGNEICYEPDLIHRVDMGDFTTLNKSNYFLVETMRHDSNVEYVQNFLYRLQAKGYSTILAHPERYDFVRENPNILIDFMEKGTYIQANMLSLIGFYGSESKHTAEIMLKNNMVQFMASDAHRLRSYELMEDAIERAIELIGRKKFNKMMTVNPAIVLSNKGNIECNPKTYMPKKERKHFSSSFNGVKKKSRRVGIQQ